MLPTGKASPEDLRKLFTKPGPHIFKDVTIPISFVGFDVIKSLISTSCNGSKTLETAFVLSKAITWCDEAEITSLLLPAVIAGNSYVVSSLIDAGADVNKRSLDGDESLVSLAIKSGDVETVRVLVESRVLIDVERDRLLHDAVLANRVDMVEVLCVNCVDLDVNLVDFELGQTVVHVAASYGNVEIVKMLIGLGCDLDVADCNGWTAVHCAAVNGHVEVVNVLLSSCGYVKYAVDKEGKTAFDLAVENGHRELYDVLYLGDVLCRAARKGDVDVMRKCLAEGARVNGKDQNGWTALHRAAFKGHVEGVKVLLDHGGLVDLVDGSGYTALHRAVEAGHVKVAMMLIAHGAKANMKSLAVPCDLDCFRNYNPVRGMIQRA